MLWTWIGAWLRRRRPADRPAGEAAEQEAARRRLLEQAAEHHGRPEDAVQRWTTVYHPPHRLTLGQQCAYRVRRG